MSKMHSEDNIEVKGKVKSIVRGELNEGSLDRLITITIESPEGEKNVDLPVRTKGEFELIPYHLALIGKTVKYHKHFHDFGPIPTSDGAGISENYELEVLSGPLEGKIYKHITLN